jgi:hypothetical protein
MQETRLYLSILTGLQVSRFMYQVIICPTPMEGYSFNPSYHLL